MRRFLLCCHSSVFLLVCTAFGEPDPGQVPLLHCFSNSSPCCLSPYRSPPPVLPFWQFHKKLKIFYFSRQQALQTHQGCHSLESEWEMTRFTDRRNNKVREQPLFPAWNTRRRVPGPWWNPGGSAWLWLNRSHLREFHPRFPSYRVHPHRMHLARIFQLLRTERWTPHRLLQGSRKSSLPQPTRPELHLYSNPATEEFKTSGAAPPCDARLLFSN